MIELRTLGVVDLKGSDGRELRPVLAQPKRLALLIYLALARSRPFHRRDSIVALFWPELDQEHARGALRVALRFLRMHLGDGVLVSRTEEELGVNPEALWCDALAFEQASEAGPTPGTLDLYRGEFLNGFYVADASPEFERWVEGERGQLRDHACRIAWELADRHLAAGAQAQSVHWARRAAAFAIHDEAAQRRLIEWLDHHGDRAGAIEVYEAFTRRLAVDHAVEPSAETQALIQAVKARRAQISPPVAPVSPPPSREPPAEGHSTPPPRSIPQARRRVATIGGLVTGLALAASAARVLISHRGGGLDPGVIAVLPFRVNGADPALSYLHEGMAELLAVKLTGDGGPRAANPELVLGASRQAGLFLANVQPVDAALGVARRFGAGRLIEGSVVGTPAHLVVTAMVLEVPSGRPASQASVSGSADSLAALVDRLTVQLLAREAGSTVLSSLTSLDALRAFLKGQAAFRIGHYGEAVRSFEQALELDSTFALAAFDLVLACDWAPCPAHDLVLRRAWAVRGRLSPQDRSILTAKLGPHFPTPFSASEYVAGWKAVLEQVPDQPEAWFQLGDAYFHEGAQMDVADWRQRAADAFRRALRLDSAGGKSSTSQEALNHLVELAAADEDSTEVRRLASLANALDSSAGRTHADYMRWLVAITSRDSALVVALRARFGQMDRGVLQGIIETAMVRGMGWEDADQAARLLRRPADTRTEEAGEIPELHKLALNRGHPLQALGVTEHAQQPTLLPRILVYWKVLDAIFWDGDSVAGLQGAQELTRYARAPMPPAGSGRTVLAYDLCALGLWEIARGEADAAMRTTSRLQAPGMLGIDPVCPVMLDAWLASIKRRGNALQLLGKLDSILMTAPPSDWKDEGNLVTARLSEGAGDFPGALRAIRRLGYFQGHTEYLSTRLHEEGRLSTLTGDTATAIAAYRHYLALRSNPEPAVQAKVQRVRERLDQLLAKRP